MRGATLERARDLLESTVFQPTRPVRGATDCIRIDLLTYNISTHAPRAGRDRAAAIKAETRDISTHAPRAGRDRNITPRYQHMFEFQPTRPVRGATLLSTITITRRGYFNPRAPCGARPEDDLTVYVSIQFQPTRPVRGATLIVVFHTMEQTFQPTRPVRGATAGS